METNSRVLSFLTSHQIWHCPSQKLEGQRWEKNAFIEAHHSQRCLTFPKDTYWECKTKKYTAYKWYAAFLAIAASSCHRERPVAVRRGGHTWVLHRKSVKKYHARLRDKRNGCLIILTMKCQFFSLLWHSWLMQRSGMINAEQFQPTDSFREFISFLHSQDKRALELRCHLFHERIYNLASNFFYLTL